MRAANIRHQQVRIAETCFSCLQALKKADQIGFYLEQQILEWHKACLQLARIN